MGNSMGNNGYEYTPGKVYERVKLLFKKAGLGTTQEDISKELHVSQSSVSKWKSGIPVDKLAAISQKFDVSLDWLVLGKEDNRRDFPAETAEKPIEEYTIKDICKSFAALARIANIDIEECNDRGGSLARAVKLEISPKEDIVFEPTETDEIDEIEMSNPLVVHYIDENADRIIDFFLRWKNISMLWKNKRIGIFCPRPNEKAINANIDLLIDELPGKSIAPFLKERMKNISVASSQTAVNPVDYISTNNILIRIESESNFTERAMNQESEYSSKYISE